MKKLEATIQTHALEAVKDALVRSGVKGMTIAEVHSVSDESRTITYRGVTKQINVLPKIHIQTVVPDDRVDSVLATVVEAARTGKEGDGWIVVSDVLSVTRIRTGEIEATDEEFMRHEKPSMPATVERSRWDVPSYQHSW